MQFMRDGGIMMWAMLAVALVSLGLSLAKRQNYGWLVAIQGAVACLAFGLVGFSAGLVAVVNATAMATPEQKWELLKVGVNEAVNNPLLGAALALGLLVVSAVLAPRPKAGEERAAA